MTPTLLPRLPALLVLAASLTSSATARAQSVWPPPAPAVQAPRPDELADLKAGGKAGLGVAVGSRPGITFRAWPTRAFAFGVQVGSTWLLNTVSADVSGQYVAPPARNGAGSVAGLFAVGLGLRTQVWFGDDPFVELAVRLPLGFSVLVQGWRLEPFVEAAPVFVFYENRGFGVEGQVGARYYF